MQKLRNIAPQGAVQVIVPDPWAVLNLAAGEVFEVPDDQAAVLLNGNPPNFEAVKASSKKES